MSDESSDNIFCYKCTKELEEDVFFDVMSGECICPSCKSTQLIELFLSCITTETSKVKKDMIGTVLNISSYKPIATEGLRIVKIPLFNVLIEGHIWKDLQYGIDFIIPTIE